MELLLTCNITDDPLLIIKPLKVEHINNVATYDVDNFSDAVSISTCVKAIDKANKLFVVFNVISNESLGSLLKVIMKLKQNRCEMRIVQVGKHEILEKLLVKMKSDYGQYIGDGLEKDISRFFNTKTSA